MADLNDVLQSIHDLSATERLAILNVLRTESASRPPSGAAGGQNPLVGLLADEPDLADAILQSAMAARETRPLRMTGG